MCFSTEASFIAGTALVTTGIFSLKSTRKTNQLAFAAIPLLFGLQQFSEGFLWVALEQSGNSPWQAAPQTVFLLFAQVLWPAWVPWSIRLMESDSFRRKLLTPTLVLGCAVSLYLLLGLIFFLDARASIVGHHIRYDFNHPIYLMKYSGIFYFIPTVLPPFLSSTRYSWILGFTILLSFIVTKIFFGEYVISIWCYFAAVMSALIYFMIRAMHPKNAQ